MHRFFDPSFDPSRPGMLTRRNLQLLFSGTLRSNLDPFNQFEDARLWDALKRSYLVGNTKPQDATEGGEPEAAGSGRFTLDTVIEEEGNNLSVGQRSLVSLARALVKDSKVLILDEATGTTNPAVALAFTKVLTSRCIASVDYETDKKIQDTIAAEYKDRTILCIARKFPTSHREVKSTPLMVDFRLRRQTDFRLSSVTTRSASWTLDGLPSSILRQGCSISKMGFSVVCATVPRFRSAISEGLQCYGRCELFPPLGLFWPVEYTSQWLVLRGFRVFVHRASCFYGFWIRFHVANFAGFYYLSPPPHFSGLRFVQEG